jgi:hypothetical protein
MMVRNVFHSATTGMTGFPFVTSESLTCMSRMASNNASLISRFQSSFRCCLPNGHPQRRPR